MVCGRFWVQRIVPLSVSGGRSGSSRKARGGLRAAEGEMSPDKRWHEWRRWHEQGGFLHCLLVCPSPNSYLISLHFPLAGCEDRPELIFKPQCSRQNGPLVTAAAPFGNMRRTLIAASQGANISPFFLLEAVKTNFCIYPFLCRPNCFPSRWCLGNFLTKHIASLEKTLVILCRIVMLWIGFLVCNNPASLESYRCRGF